MEPAQPILNRPQIALIAELGKQKRTAANSYLENTGAHACSLNYRTQR